jgi:ABC-type phosphate/phosphonate transport system substrate-binding protein
MNRPIYYSFALFALSVLVAYQSAETTAADHAQPQGPLSLIVMDPLAAPLSCPCVEGYAQRKYEKLSAFLQQSLGREVKLTFAESLAKALDGKAAGKADLIIGKHSVVQADARKAKIAVSALASLTGKDGSTTQTGLFVVAADDPAQQLSDLEGYRIFFGPDDCDEKHLAAIECLRAANVTIPERPEISTACSDGACKILELGASVRSAAVISSYAKPLLEGCGTIEKGDLRSIGETAPVPFITAFASSSLPAAERKRIADALLLLGTQPELCTSLETLLGFVPPALPRSQSVKKK